MESEVTEARPTTQSEPVAAETGKLTVRQVYPIIILLILLGIPVAASWWKVLSVRSLNANMIQVMVVILLGLALFGKHHRIAPIWNPSKTGFAMAVGAGCLVLLGGMLSIKALYWGSYLLLLGGLFWAMFGFRTLHSWLGLFIFSFFLLPQLPGDFRNSISLPLQLFSTQATTTLASLFIPITSEGNIFYINGHAFEVTVACSGLHTWIGFMFAGLLWLLFEKFSFRTLLIILASAPVLALALNSVRLFITALTAYWTSPETGIAIHTNLDYLLFPLGLVLMWQIGKRFHVEA